MSEFNVRIVRLEPMRMIAAHGFGSQPEGAAWEKINAFIRKHGLIKEGKYPATFGFNNPNPTIGSPNYGYEIWLPVEEHLQPEGDLRLVDFQGGLYAVTRFKDLQNIGDIWGQLVRWREGSNYKCGHHQCLEHLLEGSEASPESMVFDLYLPISE
jgi:DNA gyrase inhibitor GyrI